MINIERLRAKMSESEIGALLVSDIANVKWLTGFTGTSGCVLITNSAARFITDSRYTLQAEEQVRDMPTHWFQSPVALDEFIAKNVSEMGISKLWIEGGSVTYSTYEGWRDKFSGVELRGGGDLIPRLRMVKSPEEIELVRQACGVADACFDNVIRMIQPGVREWDVNLDIEFFIRRSGYELGFDPIVVSGERSARPHGKATEKKLEVGDFVTMDFGAKVGGYCSDITRTVVVAEATDRHREVYGQVLKAQLAAMEMMRPGVRAADVDRRARDVFDEIGLAKYFGHGLGHGLGSVVHDTGRMSSTSTDVLEPGQVWTVEPGVYIPGFGGVRIEDDVVVTDSGIEVLTHSPKDLMVLPK
jgi:Xaa-Pro aminopeptidase